MFARQDSALFYALTQEPDLADKAWWTWPEELRLRCDNLWLTALVNVVLSKISHPISVQLNARARALQDPLPIPVRLVCVKRICSCSAHETAKGAIG